MAQVYLPSFPIAPYHGRRVGGRRAWKPCKKGMASITPVVADLACHRWCGSWRRYRDQEAERTAPARVV
jgi:hypothetical protein